jgi:hypothetical protein
MIAVVFVEENTIRGWFVSDSWGNAVEMARNRHADFLHEEMKKIKNPPGSKIEIKNPFGGSYFILFDPPNAKDQPPGALPDRKA